MVDTKSSAHPRACPLVQRELRSVQRRKMSTYNNCPLKMSKQYIEATSRRPYRELRSLFLHFPMFKAQGELSTSAQFGLRTDEMPVPDASTRIAQSRGCQACWQAAADGVEEIRRRLHDRNSVHPDSSLRMASLRLCTTKRTLDTFVLKYCKRHPYLNAHMGE